MDPTGILDRIKAVAEAIWWSGFWWGALAAFVAGVVLQAVLGGRQDKLWPVLFSGAVLVLLTLAMSGGKQVIPSPLQPTPRPAPPPDTGRKRPLFPFPFRRDATPGGDHVD